MPDTETIQVLGRGTNVSFIIDDCAPFECVEQNLKAHLSASRGLYSRGTVSVNVGRRILAPQQMSVIQRILGSETGLKVSGYWCPPNTLLGAVNGVEPRHALPAPKDEYCPIPTEFDLTSVAGCDSPPPREAAQRPRFPAPISLADVVEGAAGPEWSEESALSGLPEDSEDNSGNGAWESAPKLQQPLQLGEGVSTVAGNGARGEEALIVKSTCRSGEVIRHAGDVVIYGDVNPGAEIIAGGDIMVLGALRGMAHAGAGGRIKSTIFALNLEAHRLQIGAHAGEAPRSLRRDRGGGRTVNPQIAYLNRGTIFVAPFVRRSEEYQGGIPYEG